MVTRVGYLEELPEGVGEQELTRQSDLGRALRLAEEFDDGSRTCADFVADVEARFGTGGDGRGVNLLTYHRSKGLEFEAVFLPRLQEGELPFKRAKSEDARQEERRLFYVGITRAKTYLCITWTRDKRTQPSSFLEEIGFIQKVAARTARPLAAAPRERRIEAATGLRVSLPGGYSGEIASVEDESVKVLLDEGTVLSVKFGDVVTVDGRTAALEAPQSAADKIFGALKAWRLERSRADEVPAFVVLHDATLMELAERAPRTLVELASVSGIGPTKIERYGGELLEVLATAKGAG